MNTFKVISPVIRLRRHGGVFKGRNNVDYPIRNAEQFEVLKSLELTADVVISCTPEERAAYEAQLSKPVEAPQAKVEAPKVQKPVQEAPKAPENVGKEGEVKNAAPVIPGINDAQDIKSDI
jgi:hypothetical protein